MTVYKVDLCFLSASAAGALLTFTDQQKTSLDDYDPEKLDSFIGAAAQYQGWIYADFIVFGYDPAAHPDARFRLRVYGIDESQITLASTKFTLTEVATHANPSASHSQWDNTLDAFNKGLKWYSAVDSALTALQDKIKKTPGYTWWKPLASEVAYGGLSTYAPYIAGVLGFVSLFIGGSSKPAPREPLNFDGSLHMDGKISISHEIIATDLALFPGTIESHYYRPVQLIPWGLFNLTRIPTLLLTQDIDETSSDYGDNVCSYMSKEFKLGPLTYRFRPDAGVRLKSIKAAFTYQNQAPSALVEPSTLSGFYSRQDPISGPNFCEAYEYGAYPDGVALELKMEVLEPVLYSDRELVVYKVYRFRAIPYEPNYLNSQVFDWQWYVGHNGDLPAGGVNSKVAARDHWLNYGVNEGRQAHPYFHAAQYLALYEDLKAAFGNNAWKAIEHYLFYGIPEGRVGVYALDGRVFDWQWYVGHNGDLPAAGINSEEAARTHWLNYGIDEGRQAHPRFHTTQYLALYEDLKAAFGNNAWKAIEHYLLNGIGEGRVGVRPA